LKIETLLLLFGNAGSCLCLFSLIAIVSDNFLYNVLMKAFFNNGSKYYVGYYYNNGYSNNHFFLIFIFEGLNL